MRKTEVLFWIKVAKTRRCWTWTAAQAGGGYGKFQVKRKAVYAHRFAYELAKGKIPRGLQIDHLCRNRLCVNPAHLEAVTCRENLLRGEGLTALRSKQRSCIRGHKFTKSNTRVRANGTRKCRLCHNERAKKSYAKIHGATSV